MKFLCLAYGSESGWKALSEDERREVLDQDARILARGDLMSAVRPATTRVVNHDRRLVVDDAPHPGDTLRLAGFSVIEAARIEDVVDLVKDTPCARAGGYIDIRAFWDPASGDA